MAERNINAEMQCVSARKQKTFGGNFFRRHKKIIKYKTLSVVTMTLL